MIRIGIAALAVLATCAGPLHAQSPPSNGSERQNQSMSGQEHQFLSYAAEDNQAEIQLCLLAEKRAQALPVKAFARLMVVDHVGVESRLAALINAAHIDVPVGGGRDGREKLTHLQGLHGAAFDQEFLRAQIEDHQNDVAKFQQQAQSASDPGVQRFALETLPMLQQHLALAQAIQTSVNQGAATGGSSGEAGTPRR